jgi:peptidoglycan/xylan/chitin deacetylase (PgdA/CDA1 family)
MMKNVGLPVLFVFCLLCSACQSIDTTYEKTPSPGKIVMFTFDDGPNPYNDTTLRLLSVLQKYEVKAAFALLGENVERCPELTRRISAEGHLVINHGYSDKWAVFMRPEEFRVNLERGEAAVEAILGPLPKIYRPQGGFYTKQQEALWRNLGYVLAIDTVRPHDATISKRDMARVIRTVVRAVKKQDGGIILLHDGRDGLARRDAGKTGPAFDRSWIPDAVEQIIQQLQAAGFRLNGFEPDPFIPQ